MSGNVEFYSKRNRVSYDSENDVVVKCFVNQADYLKEKDMYYRIGESNFERVPKVLKADDCSLTLCLEYIDGVVLLDKLTDLESKNDIQGAVFLLEGALQWLDEFYEIFNSSKDSQKQEFGIALGDVNLRNFIVSQQLVFGLDFETCEERRYIEEKVELLARYLLYSPEETEFKKKAIDEVIKRNYSTLMEEETTVQDILEFQKTLILDKRKSRLKTNSTKNK